MYLPYLTGRSRVASRTERKLDRETRRAIAAAVVLSVAAVLAAWFAHPHVTHVSRLLGRYDYFVQIAAEDVVAFDQVLDEIKAMQPGIIADIEIANIIDGLKTDDFSGLL